MDGERKTVNIYGRCGNPSEYAFEEQMATIESADDCLATASGMAAISIALFGLLKAGDHIVCDWTTYSSTHEMLDHRLTDYGITTTFVDTADIDAVANTIQDNTKVLYFETIANPTMKVPAAMRAPIPPSRCVDCMTVPFDCCPSFEGWHHHVPNPCRAHRAQGRKPRHPTVDSHVVLSADDRGGARKYAVDRADQCPSIVLG